MKSPSISVLTVFIVALLLQGCTTGQWRPIVNKYAATDQSPGHMQSTEGRLAAVDGTIRENNGYYYLCPTKSGRTFDLNNQGMAKTFVNKRVMVSGFVDYDRYHIQVREIQPIPASPLHKPNKNGGN